MLFYPSKREKSNILLPGLDEHAKLVVRMDERVGVFPEFRPARLGLFAGLGQNFVGLRLRILYDPLRLLLCILQDRLALPLFLLSVFFGGKQVI